jgi:hypothetical protein
MIARDGRGLRSEHSTADRCHLFRVTNRARPLLRRSDFREGEKYFHRLVYAPLRCTTLLYALVHLMAPLGGS